MAADGSTTTAPCFCEVQVARGETPPPCGVKLTLSCEEEVVLRTMREVHRASRELKGELRQIHPELEPARHAQLEGELERLRERFRQLKVELTRANRLKLQRLGHEP